MMLEYALIGLITMNGITTGSVVVNYEYVKQYQTRAQCQTALKKTPPQPNTVYTCLKIDRN